MPLEDRILVDLHRAASLAGRPGISVPSRDLAVADQRDGHRRAKDALSRLVRSGRVRPVRKDLVVLPDATARVTVGLPELVAVIAPHLHLITGGRAIEESHLTDQHFFSVIVLVPGRVNGFSFRGETVVFLPTEQARIWGWREAGPHYALPERAVLDAVSHPRYGVSLAQALDALRSAAERDRDFLSRLVAAARRYDSAAAGRRLGLLVEQLFGEGAAAPFQELIGASRTPVLLRAAGPKTGEIDRKWRLIVNASTVTETASA
jgi:predicted transcriptional regulator of viral defense system